MQCPRCGSGLDASWLMTFRQTSSLVHLVLKPEHVEHALGTEKPKLAVNQEGSKIHVICYDCKNVLGKKLPLGPSKTSIFAFGLDKVVMFSRRFGPKDKWGQQIDLMARIECRTPLNFFGNDENDESNEQSNTVAKEELGLKMPELVFLDAKTNNVEDFDYSELIVSDNGRIDSPLDYQIAGYVEALMQNLLLVMPTGTGKTLVGALVLAKMARLNPFHLGLVVVERVPLVFQHRDFLHQVTGLRVLASCSENHVPRHEALIVEKKCDILVVTAGLFNVCMTQFLSKFHTIIMDECHHVTGNHPYTEIVKKIKELRVQPRFVGLTASPYESKARFGLDLEFSTFINSLPEKTSLFLPQGSCAASNAISEKLEALGKNPGQVELVKNLLEHSAKLLENLGDSLIDSFLKRETNRLSTFSDLALKHRLSLLQRVVSWDEEAMKQIDMATTLLGLVDVVRECGTKFAEETLEQLRDLLPAHFKQVYFDLSPKLKYLMSEIESMRKEDQMIVFVRTKATSKVLSEYLLQEKSDMRPMMVVGKTGNMGMDWEGEYGQKNAIQAFNTGQCRILVATSVLEEGLDVAACNKVVRFDPSLSVTQFVQSKGRARASSSSMITMVYKDEIEQFRTVKMRQYELQRVLGPEKTNLTAASGSIIAKLIRAKNEGNLQIGQKIENNQVVNLSADERGKGELQMIVFISVDKTGAVFGSSYLLELLRGELETVQDFTLESLEEEGRAEEFVFNLFSPQSMAFKVKMNSRFQENLKEHFLSKFSFKLPHLTLLLQFQEEYVGKINPFFKEMCQRETKMGFGYLHFASPSEDEQLNALSFAPKTHAMNVNRIVSSKDSITFEGCSNRGFEPNKLELSFSSTLGFAFVLINKDMNLYERYFFKLVIPVEVPTPTMKSCNCIGISSMQDLSTWFDQSQLKLFYVANCRRSENRQKNTFFNGELKQYLMDLRFDTIALHDLNIFCSTQDLYERLMDSIEDLRDKRSIEKLCLAIRHYHCANRPLPYLCDVLPRIKDKYNSFRNCDLVLQRNEQMSLLKRVVITPYRVQCWFRSTVTTNRLFDLFPNDDFVLIEFKDFQSKPEIMKRKISKGIFIMENEDPYHLIASSRNQLGRNSGLFVRTSVERVQRMRNCILNEDDFNSVAKYVSRVGLFCTSVTKIAHIDMNTQVRFEDDIKARNNSLLTDGCGKIRASFIRSLPHFEDSEDHDLPSAIQIRLAGCKGVLAVVPDIYVNGPVVINMPWSMKKFDSNHPVLGMVKSAGYMNLELNREIINLLTSLEHYYRNHTGRDDFHPSARIRELQAQNLSTLLTRFEDPEEAVDILKNFINESNKEKIEIWTQKMELHNEPFFKNLLVATYLRDVNHLTSKAWISINEGCRLMGIYDFTQTLAEDDEVFCCLQGPKDPKRIVIRGRILVYRNPCLHPGDVRVVNAVESDLLYSMNVTNVLVFPASPKCSFSLTECCSGGDLDGDEFAVIWDKDLMPPDAAVFDPCDYKKLAKDPDTTIVPTRGKSVNDQELIADFVARNTNSSLGMVSNMHQGICDQLDFMACNRISIEVAKAASVAVDFPKTGIQPKVPPVANDLITTKGYPDFMNKSNSYESKNLMGELYREAKSYAVNTDTLFTMNNDEVVHLIDRDLLLEGRQEFSAEAQRIYEEYCVDVQSLLSLFDEGREEFLHLCFNDPRNGNKFEGIKRFNPRMKDCNKVLRDRYRGRFNQNVETQDRLKKASAFYSFVYDARSNVIAARNLPTFLSFPWICASEELLSIKKGVEFDVNKRKNTKKLNIEKIGESILNSFNNEATMMDLALEDRLELIRKVEMRLRSKKARILVFGSVAMLLCSDTSDIDLNVSDTSKTPKSPKFFLDSLVPSISEMSEEIVARTENTNLPLISFTSSSSIKCDLTPMNHGLLKTRMLQKMFEASPSFYLFMWVVLKWARASGIVRSKSGEQLPTLATAELYAFVLLVMKEHPLVPDMECRGDFEECSAEGVNRFWLRMRDCLAREEIRSNLCLTSGSLLSNFFERALQIIERSEQNALSFQWPLASGTEKEFTVIFKNTVLQALKGTLDRSRHALVLNESIGPVLQSCCLSKMPFVRLIPPSLSSLLDQDRLYFEEKLRRRCNINELSIISENGDYIVSAKATSHQVSLLKRELVQWSNSKHLASKKATRNRACRYFVEGSGMLMLCGGEDETAMRFEDYFGYCQIRHSGKPLAKVVVLRKETMKRTEIFWKIDLKARLTSVLARQIEKMPVHNTMLMKTMKLTVKPGQFYVAEPRRYLPDHQVTITAKELQEGMTKSRAMRRNYARKEFELSQKKLDNNEMVEVTNNYNPEKANKTKIMNKKVQNKKVNTKTKCLSSSFIRNLASDESNNPHFWAKVLTEAGFVETENDNQGDIWIVNLSASHSFEITLILDANYHLQSLFERNVNWVHCTLLMTGIDDNSLDNRQDLRLTLRTKEPIDINSQLFEFVFGDKKWPNVPLLREDVKGTRKWTGVITKRAQDATSIVRHQRVHAKYVCDSTTAIVVEEKHFDANLKAIHHLTTARLTFDTDSLLQLASNNQHHRMSRNVAERVAEILQRFSAAMERNCRE